MDTGAESKSENVVINVGSRNSQLALIQTNLIIEQLKQFYENNPDRLSTLNGNPKQISFNIISMTTTGDQILDKALPEIGSKSLFTKELEIALLEKRVDFIVHSLKDLPTTLPEGCAIGAIWRRDNPEDSIVLKKSLRTSIRPIDILFDQSRVSNVEKQPYRVGTSSQRRVAMLRHCNQRLECVNIRGNLNTRLAKLDNEDSEYSAIILARAGMDRMGWSDRASETLTPEYDSRLNHWCYAVGQGALAVECRTNDDFTIDLLSPIVDLKTTYEVIAERCLMRKLEAGCSVPLGVRTSWSRTQSDESRLTMSAIVLALDGKESIKAQYGTDLDSGESTVDKSRSETMQLTTGILITRRLQNNLVADNLEKCAGLGIMVANKMIELGCLDLMGDIHKK